LVAVAGLAVTRTDINVKETNKKETRKGRVFTSPAVLGGELPKALSASVLFAD